MRRTAVDRPPRIIVTADDFGRSVEVNRAVRRAHREGILTSVSLMVTGEAADEAVALAREMPQLAVGLHVVLVDGRSALPHEEIPHLVDPSGRFCRDPLRAGIRYFFRRAARRELRRELEAQFDRFAASGLPLSHVDGHLHMHLHPSVLPLLVPLAKRYGAGGVRVPRDRLWLALRSDRRHLASKLLWAGTFFLLARRAARLLRTHGLSMTSRTYGLMQTGRMHERYVLRLLAEVRDPSAEIYFHPTAGPRLDPLGPNPGDLESLLSPAVRQTIEHRRLQLCTWPALARQ